MQLKTFYVISWSIMVCLMSSCSSIYMPNVPATPMFKTQGEGYVSGHMNVKGNLSGSAGVAVSDHIAVIANASVVDYGANANFHFKQWLGEGALGYFTTFGPDKRRVFEVYGGYGVGNTQDVDQRATTKGYEPVERREMDFDKIFLQFNYSSTRRNKINLFGDRRELSYGTAIRLSRIGMQKFLIDDLPASKEENLFIEPVFFTRMQLSKGLYLQYTSGFNVSVIDNEYLKPGNSVHTLGLSLNFGGR